MTELKDFDEKDRFVQLDCGHIFEVSGIDQWLQQCVDSNGPSAIKLPSCPNCKAPVRHTLRYGPIIKAVLESIEAVKPLVLFGRLNVEARTALERKDYLSCINKSIESLNYRHTAEACSLLVNAAQMAGLVDEAQRKLGDLEGSTTSPPILTAMALLLNSGGNQDQAEQPIQKAAALVRAEIWAGSRTRMQLESATYVASGLYILDQVAAATALVETVLTLNPRLQTAIDLLSDIKAMNNAINLLQQSDRIQSGAWHRCPNGHLYVIGECGGAMQVSRCPDCGVEVGGSGHALLPSNRNSRVDGSQHAAWSEENNLANFALDDL